MTPIIEVKNLSKQYRIGQRQSYLSLRDVLVDTFKFRQNNTFNKSKTIETDFWALNDISFDVQAGESIGIIGRNGAGKSTLLKILSRITPPTKGKAILRGRMASLLEVGTGFHPELTGRENVYFNASILGLRKADVVKKFDEIVAFSGVEQFIDTPLKHYSSGMQLRLAFAVAAHLEPEIMVIDEVLAVGDAEFQKKCLGKMDEVSKSGRTVIFVSHSMGAIKNLCSKGILLDSGRIKSLGSINNIINDYLSQYSDATTAIVALNPVDSLATFTKISLLNEENAFTNIFKFDQVITLKVEFELYKDINNLELSIALMTLEGIKILYDSSLYGLENNARINKKGQYCVVINLPDKFFMPNLYTFNIALHIPNVSLFDYRKEVISFSIEETGKRIESFKGSEMGLINVELGWHLI